MIRNTAIAIAALAIVLSGCAMGGPSVVGVGLITDVKSPGLASDVIDGPKQGQSCASTTLGIFVSGDASIAAAKKAGGIGKVATVDFHHKGFYPFIGKTCTLVTGQ